MTSSSEILSEIRGNVGWITINRPEKRNAMTWAMWRLLGDILEGWLEHPDVRVLVVAGAGDKSFCAGNDIGEYADLRASPEKRAGHKATVTKTYDLLRNFPRPTIARVTGFCVGGGMELALLCDLQIAADTSEFGIPPARLGIGYKLDDLELVLAHISPKHAREIFFTAERFPASDAFRWGLISRAVPPGELDAAVAKLAETISSNAPLTVQAIKRSIAEIESGDPDRALCDDLVAACNASEDCQEGARAFAEKRPPKFTGK